MNHIVALSGGKDSTAMALRLREIEPDTDFRFVITPTGAELPPMEAHWRKLEGLLGKPLTVVSPGWMLKIIPYLAWLQNQFPAVSYVGLRADEEGRTGMETDDLGLLFQTRFPLREWGWGICEVLGYLDKRGVTVPDRTDCDRCYHQTLHEWWVLWREYPERWASAVEDEDRTRHTYRSEQRDTWPASLRELAKAFEERGEPKKRNRDSECKACRI